MKDERRIRLAYFASPLGRLGLYASEEALVAVTWPRDEEEPGRLRIEGRIERLGSPEDEALLAEAARELGEYFAGLRRAFDLPLELPERGFTGEVYAALADIPFGATRSYGEIAAALGRPTAARAVGAAVGRNPLSIVLPCHRVLGAKGALTGFAGGLEAKRFLLALEAEVCRREAAGGRGHGH